MRGAHFFADFETGVAWHVHVENDELWLKLVNFFKRGRAVADGNDFIPSITQNLLAHVLGSHAVVGEQDLQGHRNSLLFLPRNKDTYTFSEGKVLFSATQVNGEAT